MSFDIHQGDAASPVILHVPHASRTLTAESRRGIRLTDHELAEELDHLTDAHTDLIARRAADASAVRPWIFENRLSRLEVDPERFPDDREEMKAVGMGAVYTHGYAGRRLRDDDLVRDQAALQKHFHPYAAAVADLVAHRLSATGRAVILDVHSYATQALPYELHGTGPRPPVCLGTDDFHTPPHLIAAATTAFGEVDLNTPFAGCYVPLTYYGSEPAVTALMIEIRRDGYLTEPGGAPTAGLDGLATALTALVDAVS
ncbi:MAG: N-formylglutamate amidohydrolase [Actinoplanes sp.]